MKLDARRSAIREISTHRPIDYTDDLDPTPPSLPEDFGSHVFNDAVQRQRLPRSVYEALRRTIDAGAELDPSIADSVAQAMKEWAIERGATHYTHWFQPMTGLTAEKHDSFLRLAEDGHAMLDFSGKELIKGEPDASSFPSGGIRVTFEARGYTAWDPTSPAFLRETSLGTTLTIPTAFCSWTGDALDKKTPLLRSCEALARQATRVLNLIGEDVDRVFPTTGMEQEYFLVDRSFFFLRPDLVSCGRTVLGARPPKGQELEDHYFGAISERALDFMMDVERELWKLGIPVKTRHNEVAPSQFEFAPIFEHISTSVDHNMLTMEILQQVASRHGLRCLLHEKPFAGVNGSGKHLNWSVSDDRGQNMLDPGATPHDNLKFMLFLTAILRGVDQYQDLLRATIATPGNDHRLGANEAPPAIISVFVGSLLEEVIHSLIEGRAPQVGGSEELRLGVNTLPSLPRDISDRNRTSPFAFTGNKFEFRAVGSSQSSAYPSTVLNTIVADSLAFLADEIQNRGGKGDRRDVIQELVRETLKQHSRILFSGDNYSEEWRAEAEARGLLNLRDTPSAVEHFAAPKNVELFERHGVLTRVETESRMRVLQLKYSHTIHVEALSTRELAATHILPAAIEYQTKLATSIAAAEAAGVGSLGVQKGLLNRVARAIEALQEKTEALFELCEEMEAAETDENAEAHAYRERVLPAMDAVREQADLLEEWIDDSAWPLPKYREMLFLS